MSDVGLIRGVISGLIVSCGCCTRMPKLKDSWASRVDTRHQQAGPGGGRGEIGKALSHVRGPFREEIDSSQYEGGGSYRLMEQACQIDLRRCNTQLTRAWGLSLIHI